MLCYDPDVLEDDYDAEKKAAAERPQTAAEQEAEEAERESAEGASAAASEGEGKERAAAAADQAAAAADAEREASAREAEKVEETVVVEGSEGKVVDDNKEAVNEEEADAEEGQEANTVEVVDQLEQPALVEESTKEQERSAAVVVESEGKVDDGEAAATAKLTKEEEEKETRKEEEAGETENKEDAKEGQQKADAVGEEAKQPEKSELGDESIATNHNTANKRDDETTNDNNNDMTPTTSDHDKREYNEREALGFMVTALREELGDRKHSITSSNLTKFLNWKPDVSRAAERLRSHLKYHQSNPYAFGGSTDTDDRTKPLLISQDPKLNLLLQGGFVVAPERMVAKADGSPVMLIRLAKSGMSGGGHGDSSEKRVEEEEESAVRAILYVVDRMLERTAATTHDTDTDTDTDNIPADPSLGITIVLDMTGTNRSNVSTKLTTLLSACVGAFPLRIRSVHVVGMPWWFSSSYPYKKMLSTKLGERVHTLKDKTCLKEVVDAEVLLEEYGGELKFDVQGWISANMLREIDSLDGGGGGNFDSLSNCAASLALMVAVLRKELVEETKGVTDANLLKFLLWKPDLERASERFLSHIQWQKANPFAFTDPKPLLVSQDPMLSLVLQTGLVIAPEQMMAKDGSAVLLVRPCKNDSEDDKITDKDVCRAILYTIDRMLDREDDYDLSLGIMIILDLTGASRANMASGAPKMLAKAIGTFPLRIRSIHVVSKPWWFSSSYRNMFSPKLRERMHYLKDQSCLSEVIEADLLPEEDYGGKLAHDMHSWISANVFREVDGNFDSLANCAASLAE